MRLVCAAVIAGMLSVSARADDPEAIEYRQRIMKAMNEQAAILGQIAAGLAPDGDLLAHLDSFALMASTAARSYEVDAPGGDSKPEVWKNKADFLKRMNEFAQKTAQAAKFGHSEGPEQGLVTMLNAMDCKSCHDIYREKK